MTKIISAFLLVMLALILCLALEMVLFPLIGFTFNSELGNILFWVLIVLAAAAGLCA